MFCFHAEKNGCLPDYIPDSSSRQRKVESPGDEDKFTYIVVMMKINLPTLLCCCTWNREWGKGLLTSPVLEHFFLEFWVQFIWVSFQKEFWHPILFVSGAGETIYDLCARVPLIMSTIYIFEWQQDLWPPAIRGTQACNSRCINDDGWTSLASFVMALKNWLLELVESCF